MAAGVCLAGCGDTPREAAPAGRGAPPSILLVTLDTTRADAVGPEAAEGETPALAALAARGAWFSHAYTTAPMTLPAHAGLLTGLYPAEHGVHENSRHLDPGHELLAERLERAGYRTAAFVSGYPLDRQFGLDRGFEHYDDELGSGLAERPADRTTDRALAWLAASSASPRFVWVHYFDPHDPYEPPEPFRSRYAESPYHGEVAFVDRELGRLVEGFERAAGGPVAVVVVGDHGEGLGEHGEELHGKLLYQGVMRVPLIVVGPGTPPGERRQPVSTRRVFGTVLSWAGLGGQPGLLDAPAEVVLGEAMQPYLHYGWQPQVMAVRERWKTIRAGAIELYDVVADPAEARDLAATKRPHPEVAAALRAYPLPAEAAGEPEAVSEEARRKLASLGYFGSAGRVPRRADAPSPRAMTHLFDDLDLAAALFARDQPARAIPIFERVLGEDPGNLMVVVRLAVAHSLLGRDAAARDYFRRAEAIAPGSPDLLHYRAMHELGVGAVDEAGLLFEGVLAVQPNRLAAIDGLARVRETQGRLEEAADLVARATALEGSPPARLVRLGELRMASGDTARAIAAFERARAREGAEFGHHLELGVLYLAARRFAAARDSLDRVPASHPGWAMALFKRAQVAALLGEPDLDERVRRAWLEGDEVTRPLVERESLFRDVRPRLR